MHLQGTIKMKELTFENGDVVDQDAESVECPHCGAEIPLEEILE